MPWVFLGKSPLLTGKCIISSYTDSACNQIHKVQLCKQLVPSDTSEWKPWYQKQRKMREVQTTYSQMSQHALIVVAKEVRVKSVKPKAGLWRAPGQESNRAEPVLLPACTYLVWTEDSQILVAHTEQEKSHRKPAKKKKKKKKETCQNSRSRMCLTEWKVENLLKSKMSLLSVAALLQHEKNSESLALGHSHEYHSHRKENLANAVSSGFSSFFICWGPSQAALLGEMSLKMAVSQDSQAEILQTSTSFAVHTGTGIYFPSCSLSSHTGLSLQAVSLRTFRNSSSALLENLLRELTLDSLLNSSVPSQIRIYSVPSTNHCKFWKSDHFPHV